MAITYTPDPFTDFVAHPSGTLYTFQAEMVSDNGPITAMQTFQGAPVTFTLISGNLYEFSFYPSAGGANFQLLGTDGDGLQAVVNAFNVNFNQDDSSTCLAATNITSNSITFNGEINSLDTGYEVFIQYTPNVFTTQWIDAGTPVEGQGGIINNIPVTATVTGLDPNQGYSFRTATRHIATGNVTPDADQCFATTLAGAAPVVTSATIDIEKVTDGAANRQIGDVITSTITLTNFTIDYRGRLDNPTEFGDWAVLTGTVSLGQNAAGSQDGFVFENTGAKIGTLCDITFAGGAVDTKLDFITFLSEFGMGTTAGSDFEFKVYEGTSEAGTLVATFTGDALQEVTVTTNDVYVTIERIDTQPDNRVLLDLYFREINEPTFNFTDVVPAAPAGTTRTWTVTQGNATPTSGTGDINLTGVTTPNTGPSGNVIIEVQDTVTAAGVYQNTASADGPELDAAAAPFTASGQTVTVEAAVVPEPPTGGTSLTTSCEPACGPNTAGSLPVKAEQTGGGTVTLKRDVEQLILCDKDANGDILGTAVAVYTYDENGVPVGAPEFVDATTGDPYVPQGTLTPCEQCQVSEPQTFFFTSSVTAPTDFPGRSFSGNFTIAPGRNVTALNIGGTNFPVAINWNILDVDGEDFAAALQAAIQQRIPGSTVTVTPAGLDVCDPGLRSFPITIDCIDQDRAPLNVDIVRDAGQDLIVNPAFLRPDGTAQIGPGQFTLTARQDNGGTVACTNTANRGWETNDVNQQFEQWGAGFLGTTPTPRGTAIQEINANSNNTIWQTMVPPADGTYTLRAFVGGRRVTEQWNIRLSTGDTNDTGIGDLVNITQSAPPVGNTGSPQPWTRIEQTGIQLLGGVQYTISAKGPNSGSIGGLFTDLQLFSEDPNQIFSLAADDTCINTRDVTTNTVTCEQWTPQRNGNCEIVAWEKLDTKAIMSHAAFFAQVPAPVGCYIAPEGEEPEVTFGNLIHTYSICANGVTMQRVVITDNSGQAVSEEFRTENGEIAGAPTAYTIGACPSSAPDVEVMLVCADGSPVFRELVYRNGFQQSETFYGADGTIVTPTAWFPGQCDAGDRERICYTLTSTGEEVHVGWARHDDDLGGVGIGFFDGLGQPIDPTADGFNQVVCQEAGNTVVTETVEAGCANDVPWTRVTTRTYNVDGTLATSVSAFRDSAGVEQAVVPVGFTLGACVTQREVMEREYTTSTAICIENPAGTLTTGYSRQLTEWRLDGLGVLTDTVTTQYSTDGVTWSPTIPTGTIRGGACTAEPLDYPEQQEREYSGPAAICIEQPVGTFNTGYSRQVYTWHKGEGAPFATESVDTEYSTDGVSWSATAPVGIITAGACAVAADRQGRYETVEAGCANGVPYSRRRVVQFNAVTGALFSNVINWIDSNGDEVFAAPAGWTLGACTAAATTEHEIEYTSAIPVCVENPATTFTQWYVRQERTASWTGNVSLDNLANQWSSDGINWSATAPAGTRTLGACAVPTSDAFFSQVFAEAGCANGVPYVRRHVQTFTDGVANAPQDFYVNSAGAVSTTAPAGFTLGACPAVADVYQTTVQDVAIGATLTISPTANLISWTVRNRNATTATIRVNGGAILPMDSGETISSGDVEEDDGTLNDTVIVTAGDGVLRVTTMRRT